jgi:hypothetical protein
MGMGMRGKQGDAVLSTECAGQTAADPSRIDALTDAEVPTISPRSVPLARPNFEYQKRQKELEKKRKKEEKLKRRQERNTTAPADGETPAAPPAEGIDAT